MVTCRFWLLGQFLFLGRKEWTAAVSWLSSGDSPKVSGARPVHGRRVPGCGARQGSWAGPGSGNVHFSPCGLSTELPMLWSKDALAAPGVVPAPHGGSWCLQGGLGECWRSNQSRVPHKAELNWVSVQGIFPYFSIFTFSVCCVIAAAFHKPL